MLPEGNMTLLSRTISRKSSVALDSTFGKDRDRRVVITLHPNGLISLRPERTRRVETIHLLDVYRYAMRCRVSKQLLEKTRERKAKKAERLARARLDRAAKRKIAPFSHDC